MAKQSSDDSSDNLQPFAIAGKEVPFMGTAKFKKKCQITLKKGSIPIAKPSRRLPQTIVINLKVKLDELEDKGTKPSRRLPQTIVINLKVKLDELEDKGIISKVTYPSEWSRTQLIVLKNSQVCAEEYFKESYSTDRPQGIEAPEVTQDNETNGNAGFVKYILDDILKEEVMRIEILNKIKVVDIRSLPKAPPIRQNKRKSEPGCPRVYIDTPEKDKIEQKEEQKQLKDEKKLREVKKVKSKFFIKVHLLKNMRNSFL
ncbi:hypothetical protein QE152_g25622 [Popillia japonica]|uniref:Uncharacterized protein n=1 Tax=Popillia japonica TaxID=7064 RepID=A0AAW1K2B4_POPJA